MTDTENMPEDIWVYGNGSPAPWGSGTNYRLKSTVDAELAAKDKAIRELAAEIEYIYERAIKYAPTNIIRADLIRGRTRYRADNATQIQGAQEPNPELVKLMEHTPPWEVQEGNG